MSEHDLWFYAMDWHGPDFGTRPWNQDKDPGRGHDWQLRDHVPSDYNWLHPDSWDHSYDEGEHTFQQREPVSSNWYHVSPYKMEPGTKIEPSSKGNYAQGGDEFYEGPRTPRKNYVWMSPSFERARRWQQWGGGENAHVYEVHPGDKPQRWQASGEQGWVAPHATVKRELEWPKTGRYHWGRGRYLGVAEYDEYAGHHASPGPGTGFPIHDMHGEDYGGGLGGVPTDWQTHPQYYDSGEVSQRDTKNVQKMYNRVNGNPEAPVDMYRALPHGNTKFNTGDWVTPSLAYARQHAMHATDSSQDWPVIKSTVPAKHLWQNGDSYYEMGYHGPGHEGQVV